MKPMSPRTGWIILIASICSIPLGIAIPCLFPLIVVGAITLFIPLIGFIFRCPSCGYLFAAHTEKREHLAPPQQILMNESDHTTIRDPAGKQVVDIEAPRIVPGTQYYVKDDNVCNHCGYRWSTSGHINVKN